MTMSSLNIDQTLDEANPNEPTITPSVHHGLLCEYVTLPGISINRVFGMDQANFLTMQMLFVVRHPMHKTSELPKRKP